MSRRYTPPQIAKLWGKDPHTILALIRSGELRAVNVGTKPGGRPRYLIDENAILEFDARRQVRPATKTTRRPKREAEGFIRFYS